MAPRTGSTRLYWWFVRLARAWPLIGTGASSILRETGLLPTGRIGLVNLIDVPEAVWKIDPRKKMRSLLTRLKRLEHVQAAERWPQIELQIGYLKKLPPEYVGERHFVTVGRLSDGTYHWEERPGPAPANEDDGDGSKVIRIVLVAAKDGRAGS